VYLLCECNGTPPVKVSDTNPNARPRKVRHLDSKVCGVLACRRCSSAGYLVELRAARAGNDHSLLFAVLSCSCPCVEQTTGSKKTNCRWLAALHLEEGYWRFRLDELPCFRGVVHPSAAAATQAGSLRCHNHALPVNTPGNL
jgi:hypothetical protein